MPTRRKPCVSSRGCKQINIENNIWIIYIGKSNKPRIAVTTVIIFCRSCFSCYSIWFSCHNTNEYREFLAKVLEVLDHQHHPIVFLLWGGPARKLKAYLHNPTHLILECIHPSPLAANHGGWFGNNHFKKANEYLRENGLSEIRWSNI